MAENGVHVTDDLVRCATLARRPKRPEFRRGIPQCQKRSLRIHCR